MEREPHMQTAETFAHNHERLDGRPDRAWNEAVPITLGSQLSLKDAYARQHEFIIRFTEKAKLRLNGFKISMTNAADQVAVSANEPAYGYLTSANLAEVSDEIHLNSSNHPLVEPELVFRTRHAIDASFSATDIAQVCDVTSGLEVPICRLKGWWPLDDVPQLSLSDFILDNAGAGRVIHGRRWLPATELDLATVEVMLRTPAGEVHTGQGSRVLENPLNAMRWLAGALARSGQVIPEGSLVSSGTFMPPIRAIPGRFSAEFSLGLEMVNVDFIG